jgi:hypothetical protein
MSLCTDRELLGSLELPEAFEDLTGVLQADLRVIVTALAQRGIERMPLSRRQARQFQRDLWNDLTRSINRAVQSLDPNHP